MPLRGMINRRWTGHKEKDLTFGTWTVQPLLETGALISLLSQLKQSRMGGENQEGRTSSRGKHHRSWEYKDGGDEQKTEKNRRVFWGRLGPRRGCSTTDWMEWNSTFYTYLSASWWWRWWHTIPFMILHQTGTGKQCTLIFIVTPCILIFTQFIHQQMHIY